MPTFHENWYSDGQCRDLVNYFTKTKGLPGVNIEIGCWEGKSTVALTNAAYPEEVICCDTWQGNLEESPSHITVQILNSRNVFNQFLENMQEVTKGNFAVVKKDCMEFLKRLDKPVKFCHIDASHDYNSVKQTIELLIPFVVPGGILCGDDFLNASVNAPGLGGGVEGAVREMLPGFEHIENFWYWQKPTQ